jgi:hypothetical protein
MTGTLPASPAVVWKLVTDWEHLGDWMLEASNFVVTSEQREGVGVEAEATITIGGFRSRDRIRVSRWERELCLVIDHLGWVRGSGEMHLTPVGDTETFLLWREKLWPPLGGIGAVGLSVLKPLMHNVFRRDVRVLIALARARSAA